MSKDRIIQQVANWLPYQHSTTITGQQIADELGITQPMIHYYFRDEGNEYRDTSKGAMKRLVNEAYKLLKETDSCGYERASLRESMCCKSLIYGEESC